MEGSAANGLVRNVTDAEVSFYEQQGWALLPGLVSPEGVKAMLDQAKEHMAQEARDALDPSVRVIGGVQDVGWWTEWRNAACIERNPTFAAVALSRELGRNAQRLLGRSTPMRVWHDIVACKMPEAGEKTSGSTPWHQDGPNWAVDRKGMGFWIALDDISADQGGLTYLSGSFREGSLGRTARWRKADGTNPGMDDEYPDLLERYLVTEPFTLKAGDALCHHTNMVHGALPNRTDRPRWAYIVSFIPGDALYTGAPSFDTDGFGLRQGFPLENEARFPQTYP